MIDKSVFENEIGNPNVYYRDGVDGLVDCVIIVNHDTQ